LLIFSSHIVKQKLENAKKVGILSLTEHKLNVIPPTVFELAAHLKTLDLSNNTLTCLDPKLAQLTKLKTLILDGNQFCATTLQPISELSQLQKLTVSRNDLGHLPRLNKTQPPKVAEPESALPRDLPTTLRELSLAQNRIVDIPPSVFALEKLEKMDLSNNQLKGCLHTSIGSLKNLTELILDGNTLTSLPESIGSLGKLKVLSLKDNAFRGKAKPQTLPAVLFTDTPVIDLNLHGNPMTNTELNEFEGFDQFLERRQKVKSKTMVNLSVCGLS
jgi:Leucine-rich repeat (LRR) protein